VRESAHAAGRLAGSAALARVHAQPALEQLEGLHQHERHGQVEHAGGEEDFHRQVGAGNDRAGHAGEFQQGDGARQRAGLEHQDHFVAVGRQADAGGAWQHDVHQGLAARHAEGAGGFDLALGNGLQGATQDFRDVGGGVQGHGSGGAPEWAAQVGPQAALAHSVELRQPVVHQKQLHQQRGAAKEEDIGVGQAADVPLLRGAGDAQRDGQDEPGQHRDGDQLQGQGGALHEARQPLDDHFPVHCEALAKPRAARFSMKCRATMATTVRLRYIRAATI